MTRQRTLTDIRPFWARLTAIESPVDETEEARDSGLLLPVPISSDDGWVGRAVVLHIDVVWDERSGSQTVGDRIRPGTVVYYTDSIRVGDVLVIDLLDVIAYEETD